MLLTLVLSLNAWAQSARIVLRWKEVAGAKGYELQIAKDTGFVDVVLQTQTPTAGYRWETIPTTTHWYRVRSLDAEGRPSEWSQPRPISVDTALPVTKGPADNVVFPCGNEVELSLEANPLIQEFMIELSAKTDFSQVTDVRTKAATATVRLASGIWFWRARGVDLKGKLSDYGPVHTFSIRPSAPKVKPVGDIVLGQPTIPVAWAEVKCASSWNVELAIEGQERQVLTTPQPSMAIKTTVAGAYRVRVAAVDASGVQGDWSQELVVPVRLPTPVQKKEVLLAKRAELSWQPVPTAVSYKIDIGHVDTKKVIASQVVSNTSFRTPEIEPGFYVWRVVARDAAGHQSASTEPRSFEMLPLKPLPTPVVIAPANELVVDPGAQPMLVWRPVENASYYDVEMDSEPLGSLGATDLVLPKLTEGVHQLRVRALAEGYAASAWSDVIEIFVGVPPVERIEVAQRKAEIHVTLRDSVGRPVHGAAPKFSVSGGTLGAARVVNNEWVIPWSPDGVADAELRVRERLFDQRVPLVGDRFAPVSLALRGGGIFSGGGVASWNVNVGLAYRLPVLSRRISLELRAGLYRAAASFEVDGAPLVGGAVLIPISLLAQWNHRLGNFVLRGGLGPVVQSVALRVGPQTQQTVVGGIDMVVGLERLLGPGTLGVEVGFLWTRVDTDLAKLNAGGFGVRLGYAFDIGKGGS